jgi:hypothetical protein
LEVVKVGIYDHYDEADRQEAEALERAEGFILRVAEHRNPVSLSELRRWLEEDAPQGLERSVLRLALWSLLNENRLELTPDRELRVSG